MMMTIKIKVYFIELETRLGLKIQKLHHHT